MGDPSGQAATIRPWSAWMSRFERSIATIEPAGRIGYIASSVSRTPTVAPGWAATGDRP